MIEDFEIIHIQETGSTNSYLKELLKTKADKSNIAVYSDYQTDGRGQKGTTWESAQYQNLLFSTVLYPRTLKANQQFIISQIISLSIKDILEEETSEIFIKWPNDIYWREKKITGILIENDIIDNFITQSIIGAGLNLNQVEFVSNAPNPVSLKQITGKTYKIEEFLKKILDRLLFYQNLCTATIQEKYKNNLFRKDGFHLFADENSKFYAKINDVESSGLIVLQTDQGIIQKYAFKEVKFIL